MTLQIWVCLICVISSYSNGAVQIRAGLELADSHGCNSVLSFSLTVEKPDWSFYLRFPRPEIGLGVLLTVAPP